MSSLLTFSESLNSPTLLDELRHGLIGNEAPFETPFGTRQLLYADYVASGRALRQVETFVMNEVLPFYANSHTEASFVGGMMTQLRADARRAIARLVKAGPDSHVIFSGSGATSGVNRIVNLLDLGRRIASGDRVAVITGPYEHHSNILPWRETGATLFQVPMTDSGVIDLEGLDDILSASEGYDLRIGAFSAGSNVTGVLTEVDEVTRRLKAAGALAIWDYAAVAPYVDLDMGEGDTAKDAMVFSPHKFPGGPGASGVLVLRKTLPQLQRPTMPGGGSVTFVSPWGHHYSDKLEAREEAGTPNIIGDIRAALAMLVKEAVGVERIEAREKLLRQRALDAWERVPALRLLGANRQVNALPIFSFQVLSADGKLVHHQLFTRMLSDVHGIQVRGGCSCAGPYAHYLLGIDETSSGALFGVLQQGEELKKPGWVRLNFSYLHDDKQAERIIQAVSDLAIDARQWVSRYTADEATARFRAAVPA